MSTLTNTRHKELSISVRLMITSLLFYAERTNRKNTVLQPIETEIQSQAAGFGKCVWHYYHWSFPDSYYILQWTEQLVLQRRNVQTSRCRTNISLPTRFFFYRISRNRSRRTSYLGCSTSALSRSPPADRKYHVFTGIQIYTKSVLFQRRRTLRSWNLQTRPALL